MSLAADVVKTGAGGPVSRTGTETTLQERTFQVSSSEFDEFQKHVSAEFATVRSEFNDLRRFARQFTDELRTLWPALERAEVARPEVSELTSLFNVISELPKLAECQKQLVARVAELDHECKSLRLVPQDTSGIIKLGDYKFNDCEELHSCPCERECSDASGNPEVTLGRLEHRVQAPEIVAASLSELEDDVELQRLREQIASRFEQQKSARHRASYVRATIDGDSRGLVHDSFSTLKSQRSPDLSPMKSDYESDMNVPDELSEQDVDGVDETDIRFKRLERKFEELLDEVRGDKRWVDYVLFGGKSPVPRAVL